MLPKYAYIPNVALRGLHSKVSNMTNMECVGYWDIPHRLVSEFGSSTSSMSPSATSTCGSSMRTPSRLPKLETRHRVDTGPSFLQGTLLVDGVKKGNQKEQEPIFVGFRYFVEATPHLFQGRERRACLKILQRTRATMSQSLG